MWDLGLVRHDGLKPVLGKLTQHNTILCASTSYKLKYVPLDNLCIATSSYTHGQIESFPLIHPYVTAHGRNLHDQTRTYLTSYYPSRKLHVPTFNFIRTTHMYKPTSFRPHIPKSYIPTSVIFSIYNPFFAPHFRNSKFLHLLLSYLTLPVHIVYFLTHASICTHALMVFFTIGLTHISTTTLTHVSQYRPLITNGLYYTHKMSHHHIKKTTFAQLLQF